MKELLIKVSSVKSKDSKIQSDILRFRVALNGINWIISRFIFMFKILLTIHLHFVQEIMVCHLELSDH